VLLSVLLPLLPREPLIVLETDSQLQPGVGLVLVRVLVLSVVLEQARCCCFLDVEADLVLEIGWALERVFELQRQLVVMEDPVLVVDDNGELELELEPELQLKPLLELQTVTDSTGTGAGASCWSRY
jgi:hypothetical protein